MFKIIANPVLQPHFDQIPEGLIDQQPVYEHIFTPFNIILFIIIIILILIIIFIKRNKI